MDDNNDTGEARIPQTVPLSFSVGNQSHLEALFKPLGSYCTISTSSAIGSFTHASGTEISLAPGAITTETPASHGAGQQFLSVRRHRR